MTLRHHTPSAASAVSGGIRKTTEQGTVPQFAKANGENTLLNDEDCHDDSCGRQRHYAELPGSGALPNIGTLAFTQNTADLTAVYRLRRHDYHPDPIVVEFIDASVMQTATHFTMKHQDVQPRLALWNAAGWTRHNITCQASSDQDQFQHRHDEGKNQAGGFNICLSDHASLLYITTISAVAEMTDFSHAKPEIPLKVGLNSFRYS